MAISWLTRDIQQIRKKKSLFLSLVEVTNGQQQNVLILPHQRLTSNVKMALSCEGAVQASTFGVPTYLTR